MSLSELRDAVAELSDVNESAIQLLSGVADLLEAAARQEDVPEGGVEAEVLALAAEIRQQTGALAAAVAEVNLGGPVEPDGEAAPAEPVNELPDLASPGGDVPEPSPGDVLAEQGVGAAIEPNAPTIETVSDETTVEAPPERPDVRDV